MDSAKRIMASTPKQEQVNGASKNNVASGKRKKSRGKGSYLSKWLDKTMHHIENIQELPTMDAYDSFMPNTTWPSASQFAPGFDPCRYTMHGCTPEPMSLPTLPTYYNPMAGNIPPFYGPDCRYVPNLSRSQPHRQRPRRRSENKAEEVHSTPNPTPNGTLNNYFQPKSFTDSQDYASLPPIVTSVGDTNSNSDVHTNEKEDSTNTRRYSDPCVRGLPDVARPANGDMDSGSEASSGLSGSQVGSRLLTCLLDQIASLKVTNERLQKDLMETRAEMENVRQSAIYHKGTASVGATHTSLNNNGLLGGQYSPGFLADLVREIRDAARMREEALYSRVRAMVLERTDTSLASSDAKFNEKSLEEIKSSLRASEADKRRMMDRIAKLEDELRLIRVHGAESNETKLTNGNGNIEDPESERLRLRKEVGDLRKAKLNAEDHALKLERLVTQLRSKFNGVQLTNGPDSLPSEPDHDTSRARRSSSTNSTVVFGPVTDL